jgi:Gluconate 2-dehydrogenase subunit 3
MEAALNRRDLLKAFTAVAFTTLQLPAAEPGAPLFFTKDEFALLDALTEILIPTDKHSPGARTAGVAAYIDRSVAEAFLPEDKASWRNGLATVNSLSQDMHSKAFLSTTARQQTDLLKRMESEKQPFFGQLKETTVYTYYSSSVGIHEDMDYKGNVILQEFAGYDAT